MKIRKRFFPRVLTDIAAFIFVLLMIPATYCFEACTVLPTFYTAWSFWYTVHFICGTFIAFNVTSSFVAIIVVDTSIMGEVMPSTLQCKWRFCSVCETVAPPRSWHCSMCKTCILKRDHHCTFTGCCVGHFNHRFFMMFLFYTFLGTVYATYFNIFFMLDTFDTMSVYTLFKFAFPMAIFLFGVHPSEGQLQLLLFVVNLIAMFFTGALLIYHGKLVLKGCVTHENNHHVTDYNFGRKQNIKEVLGTRWYISWLLPFITSPLPHNGIHWDIHASDDQKNR